MTGRRGERQVQEAARQNRRTAVRGGERVTTFTVDGSAAGCTGAMCSATAAGDHTVTGTNGAAHSTATLHATAGMLDHLVLSPVNLSEDPSGTLKRT